jgi:hypothetical protein
MGPAGRNARAFCHASAGYLMLDLPGTTWWRFLIWMAIGIAIYFLYGRPHSRLQQGQVVAAEAEMPGPEGRA